MAFLRRGTVKVPHKKDAVICLTRVDGSPIVLRLGDINCWEEHDIGRSLGKLTTVYHFLSSTPVREPFDAIDQEINGKAVQP